MNTRSRANLKSNRLWLVLALVASVCVAVFPVVASAGEAGSAQESVSVPPGGVLVGDQIIFDGGKTILNLGVQRFRLL